MAIGRVYRSGLGGGLAGLVLTLAPSAQIIMGGSEGVTAIGAPSEATICFVQAGFGSGGWLPQPNGYAGMLAGELQDGAGDAAYRFRALMTPHAQPAFVAEDTEGGLLAGTGILPVSGTLVGQVRSADGQTVVALIAGTWTQTHAFGTFEAKLIHPDHALQIPPLMIGGLEGQFLTIISQSGSSSAHQPYGGASALDPIVPGGGNLADDLVPQDAPYGVDGLGLAPGHKLAPTLGGPADVEPIFETIVLLNWMLCHT